MTSYGGRRSLQLGLALAGLCLLLFGVRFAHMQSRDAATELIAPVPGPAAGTQQQPQISRGSTGTLVVWSDNRTSIYRSPDFAGNGLAGSGFDIYAARYDTNGNLIDAAPLIISEAIQDQRVPHVAWNGQNWLVTWITGRLNNYQIEDVVGVRVSPEGRILDAAPIAIGVSATSSDNPNFVEVESDGNNWAVVWGQGTYESKLRGARVAPDGTLIDTTPKILFDDAGLFTAPGAPDLAFAGNQFLLVWDRITSGGHGIRGKRFNTNLDPIDASPFTINLVQGSNATSPQVATDGTDFLVTWRDARFAYNEIFATRVSSSAQVLDPNGIKLWGEPGGYSQQGSNSLCFDGTNYVAAYHARPVSTFADSIFASRISTGGTLLTPNPIVVSTGGASLQPAIAQLSNSISQVVWTDWRLSPDGDIFTSKISSDGTASANVPASLGAPRETQPHLAFNSTGGFATIFRSTISGQSSVLFQRFDANGNTLDVNPVVVVSGAEGLKNPSLAWNGSVYLVVWELGTQIFGRRVSADGVVLGAVFAIMPGNQPDVAALGTQFLVVDDYEPTNHIRFAQAVRVDTDGNVLGAPTKIGNNYDLRPRVRAFGSRWLAIWESDITHDNPTSYIQAAFVNPDGTTPGEFTISGPDADAPHLAIAGDTALVVWEGYANTIYGRRLLADGTLLDSANGILLASGPQPLYAPAVAWDGARFIVAYNDSRNRNLEPPDDVWATLVGTDGGILTPGGFPVARTSLPEEHPIVEASNGTTVFGYAMFDDRAPYSNYRVRLRRFPFDLNYFVTATPFSRAVAPGGTTTYTVSVNALGSFNQDVALSIFGLPGGTTATFNPATVTGGSGSSTLTITTQADTPEGIYHLTITATSGIQQSFAEIVLYIDDNPPLTGYAVTDLGTLGGTESDAYGVNNNGQVAGYSTNASQVRRAFRYTNGQMQDLGTLGGTSAEAFDINDSGQVVGRAKNASNNDRAFLYNGTAMQDLGTFGGPQALAQRINNAGQVAGSAQFSTQDYHAFRYSGGPLVDLGQLGGYYSYGRGINSAGKVVGFSYQDGPDSGVRGFVWDGVMAALPTLGGRDSYGNAINDSDQIVGSSSVIFSSGAQHAFLFSGGQMRDLGTLNGAQSFAYDINNSGQVVGSIELTYLGRDYRAFLYDGTTMRNLNTLIPQDSGWTLLEARSINNNGQVVGRGMINNQVHAFLLTPVGSQNNPPSVQITTPTTGLRANGSPSITINAAASDADGTVVRVEFYANGQLIGTQTSVPFTMLWTGMATNRSYTLTARAIDDRGAATVSAPVTITLGVVPTARPRFDFDGDGKSDISVYRNGTWYLLQSGAGFAAINFGLAGDKVVPEDYDGDGKADVAVYRDGVWHLLRSQQGYTAIQFGLRDDIPQPGDYDGDGLADVAVFRPSNGTWYVMRSHEGFAAMQFGQNGDRPVSGDYDGDKRFDYAVYRAGIWYLQCTTQGFKAYQFGLNTDHPATGDYDGDGLSDTAVYRDGTWYVQRSSEGFMSAQYGLSTDVPVPADYDGDGRVDISIFRGSNGVWHIIQSTDASTHSFQFGMQGDVPVPGAYVQ